MKPMRLLLKSSLFALLSMLTFSCVDDAYDSSKISTKAEILENGIDLPIGTLNKSMDSIFKNMDRSILKVKDGVYTFCVGNTIDMSAVSSALSGFTPASISNPASTTVNMIDGSALPSVPSNVPNGNTQYSGSVSISLPSFNTSLMSPVDSILLKSTTFTMKATTNNLGGTGLNSSIVITCNATGNAAEYYDPATGNKITSWTIPVNSTTGKTIGIRILKPSVGNNLQINCGAALNVVSGSPVTITAKAMTSIAVSVGFSPIDFQTVYGKVHYSKTDVNTQDFEGFGDLASANSVLSFYNPTLKLYTNSNIGVPIKLNLNMSTKNTTTNTTASLSSTNFNMLPASTTSSSKANVFTIDQANNNLANLFKINPNKINLGYTVEADQSTSNHFINKSTFLTLADTLEIPLKFGSDFVINVGDTIDNPFSSVLDQLGDQENLNFGFLLNVTNRIPLTMKVRLYALDKNFATKFTLVSTDIRGGDNIDANGFAQDTAFTSTELVFNKEQVNQFKDISKFKVEFSVKASQGNTFVAVRPSDYIKIDVSGRISGGVVLDLKKKEDNQ